MKYVCVMCWLTMAVLLAGPALAKAKAEVTANAGGGPQPLYERLGGERGVRAFVDEFVTRAAANPRVNFFRDGKFAKTDVGRLKKHLVDFIGSAAGGSQKYTGRDLTSTHAGMRITEAEFEALAEDLAASLDHLKIPTKEKSEMLRIALSTKGAIVVRQP